MRQALALGLLLLAACHAHDGEVVRGIDLGAEVEAPGAGARAYSTRASESAIVGALRADAVQRGITQASTTTNTPLEGDGRLGLLAAWLAERMGSGATLPPLEVTRFFAWHLGMPEQTPQVVLIGVPTAEATASAVADQVAGYLRRQKYHAYGASIVDRQGLAIVVVALAARPFTLDDFPRSFAEGGTQTLRGRLAEGYSRGVVDLRRPDGTTTRIDAGTGMTLEAALPLDAVGPYEVRIAADGPQGSTIVARFPVYVGTEPPRSIRLGQDAPPPVSDSAESVAADLLTRINATRAEQGVPALVAHPGLSEVASAHSADMAEHDFLAHNSPTTGSPADRLRTAQLTSGLLLENIGRGADSASIHASLLATPQHRANMLNRDITHVGIGVVADEQNGRSVWVVTEVFVRMNQAIDVERAAPLLLAAVNRARSARHADAAQSDPNLDAAAAAAAAHYFSDPSLSRDDVMDEATAAVRRFAIAYRRVGGVMAVVTSLEEAATLEPTFDPTVTYLGIGVAQGTRPDNPPNSIVVVYLLAWSR